MNKEIFISYCWANETVVNEIDESFLIEGIKLIRDKRDTEYKDSFKEFMKRIRKTDFVLMVISDAYLKSKNCLYEVLEVLKDENYKNRIFPIVLTDAKIYSPSNRLEYLNYWKNEYQKLKTAIANYSPEEVISVTQDLKVLRDINGSIVDFMSIISDIKNIPIESLRKSKFREIKNKLGFQVVSKTKIRYDLIKQEDVSHAGAKRYTAQILIDSKYSKTEIRTVIQEVTESLINSSYNKNENLKRHFGERKADVVWLFIANRLSDINNVNWICRTSWIRSELSENMKPSKMVGNDSIDDIIIDWNNKYEELAEFHDGHLTTKDNYLMIQDELLIRCNIIIRPLIENFNSERNEKGDFRSVIKYIENHQKEIDEVYFEANDTPFAPNDCKELDKLIQSYFAHCHNLFLYYSKKGLEIWKEENRLYLMNQDISQISILDQKIIDERKRV
jgi:hypothetical protein